MPFLRFLLLGFTLSCIAFGQAPRVASSFPNEGATNLGCYTEIKLTLEFPSEATSLDPITLNTESVILSVKGKKRKKLPLRFNYTPTFQLLTISPDTVLESEETYELIITDDLADGRGYRFLPFSLSFSTGDCAAEGQTRSEPLSTLVNNFSLKEEDESLLLQWESLREVQMAFYYLERSSIQDTQRTVALIQAEGKNASYEWIDTTRMPGKRTYVLIGEDEYGNREYWDTVTYFKDHLLLQQNVLRKQDSLQIAFWSPRKTTAVMILKNREGKQVLRKAGFIPAGKYVWRIGLAEAALEPDVYALSIRTGKDQRFFGVKIVP